MTDLIRDHAYQTTWSPSPGDTVDPRPDLDRPCPTCREPVMKHAWMSLEPLNQEHWQLLIGPALRSLTEAIVAAPNEVYELLRPHRDAIEKIVLRLE